MHQKHLKPSARWIALSIAVIICGISGGYYLAQSKGVKTPTGSAPHSVRAIDTAATITDQTWFERAYDEGFRLYVLHSTDWGTCNAWYRTAPQLKMALDAGLKIAAYTRDPQCWREGILAAEPYASQLQFFALDIETKPGIPATREMVDGIKSMSVRPVIYTGSGMWSNVQGGDNIDFSDVALWDTNVSEFDYAAWTADFMTPTPVVYGGWNTPTTMRVGIQQQFEYNLNGVNVDLNSFQAKFLR